MRNGIYESIVKHRWSKIDQENLEKKVETWKRENPHENMVFKQYASDQETAPNGDDSDDGGENGDEDEDVELTQGNGLLFVHQTEWQSRLLKRYGNELSLLDATYRTTKYALPLFFLVVKTNIDYQIVGSFVLQSEASPEIERALRVIAGWNDGWSPKYFMVDYSEAEIQAVGRLFSGKTDMKDFTSFFLEWGCVCVCVCGGGGGGAGAVGGGGGGCLLQGWSGKGERGGGSVGDVEGEGREGERGGGGIPRYSIISSLL